VEFGSASYNWPRHVGKNARIGVHGQYHTAGYVKLYTDQGASGWGLGSAREEDREVLEESMTGKTVDTLIHPSLGISEDVHRAFDIALHDLAGVILGQPVYRMLGADGERNPDFEVCLQLTQEDKLDVYLPDVIGYGLTPWRKLMPTLMEMNTITSPHAWGSRLKTHYISHIAAGLGNVCTIEGVTCLSDEIDFGDYDLTDGKLRVSEKPGFGMDLL
jgi:L-alanine-DL-glutamate epimerase-like enolase superfamily enzyme